MKPEAKNLGFCIKRMKSEAKNLGFCIKLFNYIVLFAQATFNAMAGYVPVYTVFLFTLCYDILN